MQTSLADIKIGGKQIFSAGNPTTRSVPVGRTQENAMSYAALAAEATSATWTPPLPRNSLTALPEAAFSAADAPSDFASASFSSEISIAVTSAPSPTPSCTASCPKPPTPNTANRWPGDILAVFSARKAVTPAQNNGAASLGERPSGIFITCLAGACTCSAYPPSTVTPVIFCLEQRFSFPSRQNSHSPHVQCTHGIPTRSPICKSRTSSPFSTTRPAIS